MYNCVCILGKSLTGINRVVGEFRTKKKEIHIEETKHFSHKQNLCSCNNINIIIDLTKYFDIIKLKHSKLRQLRVGRESGKVD